MTRKYATILAFAGATLAAVAIAVASPAATLAGTAQTKRGPISPSSAFTFPSTKVCVSGHTLTFRMRKLSHVTWKTVKILVNGKRFKTVKLSRNPKPVVLSGLPDGKFVLRVTAATTDGRHVTASRTYNSCAPTGNTLAVSRAGSGSVTAVGISCPGTCSHDYRSGAIVVLYQAAAAGSTFAGWSGTDGLACGLSPFCVVYMTKARSVTATFQTVPSSGLTVHRWGSGSGTVTSVDNTIDCGNTCSTSYAYGTHVTLTAAAASGSTFVGWSGGGCKGTGTCAVTVNSVEDVTATFEKVPVASETPGHYTGKTQNNVYAGSDVSFYVSPDGSSVEDVEINPVDGDQPACTPSGSVNSDLVAISSIPIDSNGSFSSSTTQTSLVDNQPATFTYTFAGQFSSATTITGTWREEVTYTSNGTPYSCTTGDLAYSTTWDTGQVNQNTSTALPGHYSGTSQNNDYAYSDVSFYVSPDGGSIEDVAIFPAVDPDCAPSGSVTPSNAAISSIPINSDGSFASTTTQTRFVANQPATFTYTFTGHLHGPWGSQNRRIDGMWREDVTYTSNSTSYSCTTGNLAYYAPLDAGQTNQDTPTVTPGSYSSVYGDYPNTFIGVSFYVSPDRGSIEDVKIGTNAGFGTNPLCTPSGIVADPSYFRISSIPINGDGSFSSTTTQTDLVQTTSPTGAGYQPGLITYTFDGHFHGPTTDGVARVNGILREDVTYGNGTRYSCTTGNQPYSVHWEPGQINQTNATASPGTYHASYLTFSVSSDSSTIDTVSGGFPNGVGIGCTVGNAGGDTVVFSEVTIASIPIRSDGSFSYTATKTGSVETNADTNQPATITYTFNGHVHGPDSNGKTRIAGIWREDVAYANSGKAYYCSSNNQLLDATQQ